MSNLRAAYAEVTANYLANGGKAEDDSTKSNTTVAKVTARQTQSGWQNTENGKLQVRVNGAEKAISFNAKKANSVWTVKIVPTKSTLISIS